MPAETWAAEAAPLPDDPRRDGRGASVFVPAIEALAAIGLPEGGQLVVEKPFAEDLASAQALNRLLHRIFAEHAVFRIDHFLGKQTVQNILGLRFANRLFEPLWNSHHIAHVDIT